MRRYVSQSVGKFFFGSMRAVSGGMIVSALVVPLSLGFFVGKRHGGGARRGR